ncbi:inhibitor of nuclear factor kappa-B kinase-interacting protein isoform X1 [Python bivittatus]|uniref:Inhibitor of nuclear factor kappa-B kinase-interacting protein isoform X1 n=1 Tax=Python bivittatus TaxID=176946 RepID=A0A9F2NUX4_PYTBI|nr:inhibitor of nuclear factor kappa-B kinase-interacting protein isoform X1 [Python bivittatus]
MFEVKRRRRANISKPNEDQQKKQSVFKSTKSRRMDLQTASSFLSLVASLGLSWFLFQQSVQLAAIEKKYHILKEEAVKFQDMENKISIMSEKFASSSVLQEAPSYVSMVTNFEQEVSSLHNFIEDIQSSEKTRSKKFQTISENFQRVVDSWKRSKSEMDTNTSNFSLETKFLHREITSQINTVDQGLKKLSERLKDLEDSTVRNLKTLNRQEEDILIRIEEQLQLDKKTAKILKQEHNRHLVRSNDLYQKLVLSEHKLKECETYLPAIESAIYSILKLSSELVAAERKKEDMITKVFSAENEMMKAISEITNIQNTLEGMQHEDSILTLQNEPLMLQEKIKDFAEETQHSMNSITKGAV